MNHLKYASCYSNFKKISKCCSSKTQLQKCNINNILKKFSSTHLNYNENDEKIDLLPNQNDFNKENKTESNLANDVINGIRLNQIKRQNTNSIFLNPSVNSEEWKKSLQKGPDLKDFIGINSSDSIIDTKTEDIPYVTNLDGNKQKVFLDIYGCQMNVNDAEVIGSILKSNNYDLTKELKNADIALIITCSIRDNAEQKIWHRLKYLRHLKQKKDGRKQLSKIGILGCMAERLKHKIVEKEKIVDVIAGPDSYKDLPRLLSINDSHETAINVTLSFDETYATVTPVRLNPDAKTAYVTIMRGCNNMCTYCIVPFTRGRERSRPIDSIIDEVKILSEQGVKEVILLGQNVNSYRDISESSFYQYSDTKTNLAKGFKTVYKNKEGGLRFSDLLDKVSLVNPEMRVRFTSPHPKDFPDEVLDLISERPNICNQLHIPAQSGSSKILEKMRRGYTREAYLDLICRIRNIIPNISLSSDFICGFCDESDADFEETLTLIEKVKYNMAYLYAYSMREKTTAHRRFLDNVPKEQKQERLRRMIKSFRAEAEKLNKNQIGQQQLILVEGTSKRSENDLQGRNDGNTKVIFRNELIPEKNVSSFHRPINNGDYIAVHICNANSQVLTGIPLYHSSITEFYSSESRKQFSIKHAINNAY